MIVQEAFDPRMPIMLQLGIWGCSIVSDTGKLAEKYTSIQSRTPGFDIAESRTTKY